MKRKNISVFTEIGCDPIKTLITIDIKNITDGKLLEFTHNGVTYTPSPTQPTKSTQPTKQTQLPTQPPTQPHISPFNRRFEPRSIDPTPKPPKPPTSSPHHKKEKSSRPLGRIVSVFDDSNIYKNVLDYCIIAKRNNIPCKTQGDALKQYFPDHSDKTRLYTAYKYSSYIKQKYSDNNIPLKSINLKKRLTKDEAIQLRGPCIGKQKNFSIHEKPFKEILRSPIPNYRQILTKYYPNIKSIYTYIYVYKKFLSTYHIKHIK